MRAKANSAKVGQGKRETVALSRSLEKHLLAYVIAGAGVAIASMPAEGQIVYTPSNIPLAQPTWGRNAYTGLDLDNDGIADFQFGEFYRTSCSSSSTSARSPLGRHGCFGSRNLKIEPLESGNAAIAKAQSTGLHNVTAQALGKGVRVGSSGNFASNSVYMARYDVSYVGSASGTWVKVQTAYLGLKFTVDGQVHYGWARVKFAYPGDVLSGYVQFFGILTGTISGYAYEGTPNKSILTGQTSEAPESGLPALAKDEARVDMALGLLASGARGVQYWRESPGK